jgi:hypothetical protein
MDNAADRQALKVLSPEDLDEVRDHVVARTSRGVSRDDILLAICETHNLSWPQAEALVDEILAGSSREVSLQRDALLGMIALFTFLGGGLLAVESGYRLVDQITNYPFDTSGVTLDLIMTVISENYPLIVGLLFSSVLIVVGLRGLWRSVGDFFLSLLESDAGS